MMERLPAQKASGRYRTNFRDSFVEAVPFTMSVHGEPSRLFREGAAIFAVNVNHTWERIPIDTRDRPP